MNKVKVEACLYGQEKWSRGRFVTLPCPWRCTHTNAGMRCAAVVALLIPAFTAAFSLRPLGASQRACGLARLREGPRGAVTCRRHKRGNVVVEGLRMGGLDEEIAAVRGMKVADIKRELVQRGLSINDMFEKDEFVKRLAEARVSGGGGEAETSSPGPETSSAHDREANVRAEVSAMQISEIKAQLAERGVASQGLFEKGEFVELLVRARLDAPESRRANGSRSSEFKDVQTQKMPKKEAAEPKQSGAGGSPFGGVGAGMPNPFAGMQGVLMPEMRIVAVRAAA